MKTIKYILLLFILTQLTGCASLMWNDYWGEKHWWNKESKIDYFKYSSQTLIAHLT